MKKEYVACEIEIIELKRCDIITESDGSFNGGYNDNGWT